jgi:hypothetical protein
MSEYKYVVAIDAGYRNFAVCAVDNTDWQAPSTWYAEDLWRKRPGRRSEPDKNDCVEIALLWIKRNKAMLDRADAIVLENQMRTPYIIINATVQAHYFEKCVVVHPMTVAAFWSLPKTRELKKAAGVATVKANGVTIARDRGGKLDDMADAWLMAVYFLVELDAVRQNMLVKERVA